MFLVNLTEAEAFAAKYVDTFRGLSAGCFHSCLLQLDGQLILLGEAWQMLMGMIRFLGWWLDITQRFCCCQIIFH